ncbi:MAG: hypothetical protein M0027_12365 [Candidatus Dormibacteraeota bacterium]|jgi:hypothetical protein|nr:hypothetical protein [Candidatus Dormibacteraeota bacterium]
MSNAVPHKPSSTSADGARLGELGLLTSDLMVVSRVRAAAAQLGWAVRQIGREEGISGIDLLLVDLNRDGSGQLARLRRLTGDGPAPEIVAFGPHMAVLELRPLARAAGVRRVVANSALPRVLKLLVRRREAEAVVAKVTKA